MFLYVFFSYKKNINNSYDRISIMMNLLNIKDYLIIVGGEENKYNDDNHILNIKCNDNYEGLPEKVIKTYNFIFKNSIFSKYNFFVNPSLISTAVFITLLVTKFDPLLGDS